MLLVIVVHEEATIVALVDVVLQCIVYNHTYMRHISRLPLAAVLLPAKSTPTTLMIAALTSLLYSLLILIRQASLFNNDSRTCLGPAYCSRLDHPTHQRALVDDCPTI